MILASLVLAAAAAAAPVISAERLPLVHATSATLAAASTATSAQAGETGARAKARRLEQRIHALGRFGANPAGGVSRVAFSDADIAGRQYIMSLMRDAGLEVRIDAAGNIIGRRAGTDPALPVIMTGSHIDSVPQGGNYDGDVGVLGAIEVAELLREHGIATRHPFEFVVFTDEEGGVVGSQAMAGGVGPGTLDVVSHSGLTIRDGIRTVGGDPSRLAEARRAPGTIAAFVELHIEQGAILDEADIDIGVVEGIVGIRWWDVTVEGTANHAGTTPMNRRRDALLAASELALAINRIASTMPGTQVATVGRIRAEPGAPNVIPGRVEMSLEIRDLAAEKIESVFRAVEAEAKHIAGARGTPISFSEIDVALTPAPTDERLRKVIEAAAASLGLTHRRLPSGAGHDAQDMAHVAPMAMIFVPSQDGISHAPQEYTTPADIANGVDVLLRVLLAIDRGGAMDMVVASAVGAHDPTEPGHAGHPLGTVEFRASCSQAAQAQFDHALALLHHMTYPQAREGFRQVAVTDPKCAMAHWGVAMTLFQPLWPTRPGPQALQQGWDAVQKAKELEPPTERERLFVAAVEAFFIEPEGTDYWLRIGRWEQAQENLYTAFPDDPEAAAFYALAHLATTPPDRISRTNADRSAEILLRVYQRNPDHPGAMHYLVHANDVPGRERESLEITHKYDAAAPRNPHALHMPTHIYTRLGDWDGVIRGNLLAAEAALEHPAGDAGQYVWDEFPHAIEYLVYAYLQQGADAAAATQRQRLLATERLEPTFKTAFHLASVQARYALERHAWSEAAGIVPRMPAALDWDRYAWAEATAQFARGLGATRTGRVEEARSIVARLEELEAATRNAKEPLFARNIEVMRLELSAWLAHAEGRSDAAETLMRNATDIEAVTPKHAVTPGPTLPAYEQLGDLLMELKRPEQALLAYQRALALYPNRFNSLLGAARAAASTDNGPLARTLYQALLDVAKGDRKAALSEARAFLTPH